MPIFHRPDGALIKNLSLTRRIMPFLMRGRNESVVYYEQVLDLTRTLPFIERWNAEHAARITVFHLIVAAAGKALIARPGLNRFVSGGRIYQRSGAQVSFAAKKQMSDGGALATVKLEMITGEALEDTVARLHASVNDGRGDKERAVDKELKWIFRIPSVVLSLVVVLGRLLDRWNLFPSAMIKNDPLFTSLFVANLGSVGIDKAVHHLYEWGTCSLFCVIGTTRKELTLDATGAVQQQDVVSLRFAFDERINDGYYCAASLDVLRRYVEDPELFAREPTPTEARPTKPKASSK